MRKSRFVTPLKALTTGVALCSLLGTTLHAAVPRESKKIDQLVEAGYKKYKVKPNPRSEDHVFLRRAYLDMIGRIPTQKEAEAFYKYEGADRRARLIDYLSKSVGAVSHNFNYWADILRIKSRMNGNSGMAYVKWVKDSLRENKPYDQFVKELITAQGNVWDNGAVGYYLRDSGMPLDNMSNTTQIFLGTQLVCAQCHNHPFDVWTQRDYYEMAAFTYGVNTRRSAEKDIEGMDKAMASYNKRRKGEKKPRNFNRALNDILEPLSYGVKEDPNRMVKLPEDYQYEDKDKPLAARVLFGEELEVKTSRRKMSESRRKREEKKDEASKKRMDYAEWMTATHNPRFTRVVANRLWKRAMGMGLVEPVDNYTDNTQPSNPELLDYLEEVMRRVDYDLRKFMHVLYQTKTYQRAATIDEVPIDKPYHFAGPLLRRMTAEQYWDSLVTVAIPDPDKRMDMDRYKKQEAQARAQVEALRKRDPKDIIAQAEAVAKAMDAYDMESRRIREYMQVAQESDDQETVKRLRKELSAASKKRNEAIKVANASAGKMGSMMGSMTMDTSAMMDKMAAERAAKANKGKKKKVVKKKEDPWKGYGRHLMRASEIQSPAPNGHFLREFGQSDRDTIENSHKNTSAAQALLLLNSNLSNDILSSRSMVMKGIAAADTPEKKEDAMFLTLLSRYPSDKEREMVKARVAERGDKGYEDIVFALVNTSEFVFLQ